MENAKKIKVRFPPSPTGRLHVGNVRSALYNWLFARQHGGIFLFRFEDTDKERSELKYEASIIEALQWVGLNWDEGIGKEKPGMKYRQSERVDVYEKYLDKLIANKKAYWCYCTKEELEADKEELIKKKLPQIYVGHCRDLESPPQGKEPQVIRFRTPDAKIEFDDIVRGHVTFEGRLIGDFVIGRKPGEMPLYHFAVAIDDYEMEITHVIRGEERLTSTPKQILILRALGFDEPIYAHLPLILNANRGKLSKREADTALLDYRKKGFLPEAMFNFLAFLGWHPQDNEEIFTKEDLTKIFDLSRVQKAGAVFNLEKLEWFNKEHIKRLSIEELAKRVRPYLEERHIKAEDDFLQRILSIERERITTLAEFADTAGFFFSLPDYEPNLLVWKESDPVRTFRILTELKEDIESIKGGMNRHALGNALADIVLREGRGPVLWPLRVAVSGLKASPDPMEIVQALGGPESVRRIDIALEKIKAHMQ